MSREHNFNLGIHQFWLHWELPKSSILWLILTSGIFSYKQEWVLDPAHTLHQSTWVQLQVLTTNSMISFSADPGRQWGWTKSLGSSQPGEKARSSFWFSNLAWPPYRGYQERRSLDLSRKIQRESMFVGHWDLNRKLSVTQRVNKIN